MFVVVKKKMIIFALIILVILFGISALFKSQGVSVNSIKNGTSDIVVIDPGHGGIDGGCVGEGNILEKDLNLKVARKLEKIFSDNGYKVVMTRTEDRLLSDDEDAKIRTQKTQDLKKRAEIANKSGGAIFISVHMNEYTSPEISGAQVFYNKNDKTGEKYAKSVMSALKKVDAKNKRVSKEIPNKNLVFNRLTIPGILVECGFLSNPEECKKLQDELYQNDIANAIYNGIVNVN